MTELAVGATPIFMVKVVAALFGVVVIAVEVVTMTTDVLAEK